MQNITQKIMWYQCLGWGKRFIIIHYSNIKAYQNKKNK